MKKNILGTLSLIIGISTGLIAIYSHFQDAESIRAVYCLIFSIWGIETSGRLLKE